MNWWTKLSRVRCVCGHLHGLGCKFDPETSRYRRMIFLLINWPMKFGFHMKLNGGGLEINTQFFLTPSEER